MTLVASWEMAPPDRARWSEALRIAEPGDVDVLLRKLAGPLADDAYLGDARFADRESSPVVTVAVRDRWVYLTWADGDFYGAPAGDRRSPRTHGGHNPEYCAGTGVSPDLAARALKQWLATGQRPDAVTWLDDEELLARSAIAGHAS